MIHLSSKRSKIYVLKNQFFISGSFGDTNVKIMMTLTSLELR